VFLNETQSGAEIAELAEYRRCSCMVRAGVPVTEKEGVCGDARGELMASWRYPAELSACL